MGGREEGNERKGGWEWGEGGKGRRIDEGGKGMQGNTQIGVFFVREEWRGVRGGGRVSGATNT